MAGDAPQTGINTSARITRLARERDVDGLLQLLDEPAARDSWRVRRALAIELGELGDVRASSALTRLVQHDERADVRVMAAKGLGRVADSAGVAALADAVRDPNADANLRIMAAKSLGESGSADAVDALGTMLRADDKTERTVAARALGEIGGSEAVALLVSALGDDTGMVRVRVAKSLAKVGDHAALRSLREARRVAKFPSRRSITRSVADLERRLGGAS